MIEHGGSETHSIAITVLTRDDAAACEQIARSLPAWFGIEEAFADIRAAVEMEQGFAARVDDEIVGFVTLAQEFPESMEFTWMAVSAGHHRQGIGRALVDAVLKEGESRGVKVLLVKTLAATHPSPEYVRTRAFYRAVGFVPVTVLPELWSPANPCLLMVRTITPGL